MPVVRPSKQRHVIQEDRSSLKITIPSRKNYFMLFFLGFWLMIWAIGENFFLAIVIARILHMLFTSFGSFFEIVKDGFAGMFGSGLFLQVLWLGAWTVGGCFALYTCSWQLAGKENIEVTDDMIKLRNAVFLFGQTEEYLATHIKDLRVSTKVVNHNSLGWSKASSFRGGSSGLLAFDYGAITVRFGRSLDEAEAKQILERISSRFPHLMVRKP
jgi:hypothetical protein